MLEVEAFEETIKWQQHEKMLLTFLLKRKKSNNACFLNMQINWCSIRFWVHKATIAAWPPHGPQFNVIELALVSDWSAKCLRGRRLSPTGTLADSPGSKVVIAGGRWMRRKLACCGGSATFDTGLRCSDQNRRWLFSGGTWVHDRAPVNQRNSVHGANEIQARTN